LSSRLLSRYRKVIRFTKVNGLVHACRELAAFEVPGSRSTAFLEETLLALLQGLYGCH